MGLPGITKYHHFRFGPDASVRIREFANGTFRSVTLMKGTFDVLEDVEREDIISEGLSAERQWYLYTDIRCLCTVEEKKDAVAPLPLVPKKVFARKKKAET